jgi:hypothetical protein
MHLISGDAIEALMLPGRREGWFWMTSSKACFTVTILFIGLETIG